MTEKKVLWRSLRRVDQHADLKVQKDTHASRWLTDACAGFPCTSIIPSSDPYACPRQAMTNNGFELREGAMEYGPVCGVDVAAALRLRAVEEAYLCHVRLDLGICRGQD